MEKIEYKTITFRLRLDDLQEAELYNRLMNCRTTTDRNDLIKQTLYNQLVKVSNDFQIDSPDTATSILENKNESMLNKTNTDVFNMFNAMFSEFSNSMLNKFSNLESKFNKIEAENKQKIDNIPSVEPVKEQEKIVQPVESTVFSNQINNDTESEQTEVDPMAVPEAALNFLGSFMNKA